MRLTPTRLSPRLYHPLAPGFAAALVLSCAAAAVWSSGQAPAAPTGPVRTVVVLDPAHGASDTGAQLGDQTVEKDVVLALASKLRGALSAAGFTVVLTRDTDPENPISADQRAEVANRKRALACLTLHATGAGSGVHIYASPLQPPSPVTYDPDFRPPFQPVRWDQAQADSVRQSLRLEDDLNAALSAAKLPALRGRASVPPLDNLTCPALAIELAPLGAEGESRTGASDSGYQQRVAEAVVVALKAWRDDPLSHPASTPPPARPAPATGASQ